jgi:hypothetical protein
MFFRNYEFRYFTLKFSTFFISFFMSTYPNNEDMLKYFREDTNDTTVTLSPKKEEGPLRVEFPSLHGDCRSTIFHGPSSEIRNLPGYSFLEAAVRERESEKRSAVFDLNYDIYGNKRPEGFFDYYRYFKQIKADQILWNASGWRGLDRQTVAHIHNPHVDSYRADPISSLSITFRASSIIFISIAALFIINPTDSFGLLYSSLRTGDVLLNSCKPYLDNSFFLFAFNLLDAVYSCLDQGTIFTERETNFFIHQNTVSTGFFEVAVVAISKGVFWFTEGLSSSLNQLPFFPLFFNFSFSEFLALVLISLISVHSIHGFSHIFMDQSIGTNDIRTRSVLWRFLERFFVLLVLGIL